MAEKVEFELVSPERLVLSEPVEMVVVPGGEGDFGVLPGHSPFISTVRPGVIDVHNEGKVSERIFVAGGYAEATPERCTVLAEEALHLADLDAEVIEARAKRAREDLADADSDEERIAAEAELAITEAMTAALAATERG
jgi:F-type H+-transporting ATPase subunit epsilon